MHTRRSTILLLFLLSGVAGLVYEVVWSRQLVLVFGNTTEAISAILTGFFGGMAIGSVAGGRLADRVRSPLRLYALLELVLVVVVLLTPFMFLGIREVYRGAYPSLETAPVALALVRFALSLLALAPATILMGATLPALSRHLVRDHHELGEGFGELYTANTLGGVVGTLAAGLVLIEVLGLSGALRVGALCSATAGLGALVLSRWWPEPGVVRPFRPGSAGGGTPAAAGPRPVDALRPTAPAPRPEIASRPRLALAVAFVSGFTALGYQTLWTRMSASGSDSSTYVFTGILTCFLIGIAVGAAAFSLTQRRIRRPVLWLGLAQLALALVVLVGLGVETRFYFPASTLKTLVLAVLPATLVLGVTLPMSSMLVAERDERVGTSAGALLGVNTFGAIIGTFVVPFVLIPALTSPRTVVLLAVTNALLGVALMLATAGLRRPIRLGGGALGVVVVAAAVILLVTPNMLVADPAVNALGRQGDVIYRSAEDQIASVQAGQRPDGGKALWVGGISMTALTVDAKLMPDLPLMLRPDAKSICIIAFGMGTSYRSALIAGLQVDDAELVPSVPGMFGYFYADAASVLANPDGRVVITDGRNHVELTSRHFDLAMADPPPPIRSAGAGVLYSREYYQAIRARLNPGGVMMEWIPYDQTVDEFRAHVQTMHSVFPDMMVVFGPRNAGVYMLGSDEPLALTEANVQAVLSRPGVAQDLADAPNAPIATPDVAAWTDLLLGEVWIQGDQIARFAGSAPLITDDRPYTEYDLVRRAVAHFFGPHSPKMTRASLQAATPPP